jgi:SagB-type dehydrogenase family enzyme
LVYHEATKHSEVSIGASAHYLDWDNKPSPFKEYANLPSVALPRNFPIPETGSISAIKGELLDRDAKANDIGTLAELLFFSAGITRKMKFGKELHYMRAASATGALYPIEVYVISGKILGLEAGVYHFNPLHFSLVKLRDGDYRSVLDDAGVSSSLHAPFTFAFTSLAWRNAWKYEARSYRHWFWDSGVIVANLLATSHSAGLAIKVALGFADSKVDHLLGLEPKKEATVALAAIGANLGQEVPILNGRVLDLAPDVTPSSKEEIDYPIIWETNEASQLKTKAETVSWIHGLNPVKPETSSTTPAFPIREIREDQGPPLNEVILLRGSTRKFARRSISFSQLSGILKASITNIPLDFLPDNIALTDFYFIVNDVDDLAGGSYFYNQKTESIEQLKILRNRSMSGYLCLGQPLFSDASAVFFLMTDLNSVLQRLGNRGYRAVQFEAGVRAGDIYLSSYALGLGASGSTFFDDAVTQFFSPHSDGKNTMIAVGVGHPTYKAKPGRILPQLEVR